MNATWRRAHGHENDYRDNMSSNEDDDDNNKNNDNNSDNNNDKNNDSTLGRRNKLGHKTEKTTTKQTVLRAASTCS